MRHCHHGHANASMLTVESTEAGWGTRGPVPWLREGIARQLICTSRTSLSAEYLRMMGVKGERIVTGTNTMGVERSTCSASRRLNGTPR